MEVTKRPLAMLFTVQLGLALLCFTASTLGQKERSSFKLLTSRGIANNGASSATWCIAKPSADVLKLHHNIDFSCGQAGIDCRTIQPGGGCFSPDNAVSHASVAMNLFYRATGKHPWDCHFEGTGLIVHQNPSVGACEYPV